LIQVWHHQGPVILAEFSPDGGRIVTACRDGTARVWDAASGQPVTPPLKHNSAVHHATFSPDGRRVVTASDDGTARVWDAISGQPVTLPLKHNSAVHHATFSPDGRRVVTASSDQTARVWDAIGGQPVTLPLKHNSAVHHAMFSPDGRRVVTASSDQTARVWDAASGQPLSPPLKHNKSVHHATFSPDGRRVMTGSYDGARVWDLPLDERPDAHLLQLAEFLAGYRLDEQGGLVPLDPQTWITACTTLRQCYPAQFTSTKAEIAAWPSEAARACADANLWPGAILHLDLLIEADPTNREFRWSRGQAQAALQHWAEAAADSGKYLEGEADWKAAGLHALYLAAAGDWAAHRQACGRLLERFAKMDDAKTANDVAWYCVRFREGSADPSQPLKLAEQAVAAAPQDPGVLNTLGAAL
jgi:hypothetical protein